MPIKINELPIIRPIISLLHSRKLVIALATLVVVLLVRGTPELQPIADEMVSIAAVMALALVGGITVEDAAKHVAANKPELPKDETGKIDQAALTQDIAGVVLDELVKVLNGQPAQPEIPAVNEGAKPDADA